MGQETHRLAALVPGFCEPGPIVPWGLHFYEDTILEQRLADPEQPPLTEVSDDGIDAELAARQARIAQDQVVLAGLHAEKRRRQ